MLVRFSSATEREGSETFYDVEQGKKDNIEPTCSEEGLLTHAVLAGCAGECIGR